MCTGALLLTAAGPARNKRVTTHWGFVPQLRERGEAAEVLENIRYVRDGNVVTAAGVSAGIDMALWLTGQLHTPALARAVQRFGGKRTAAHARNIRFRDADHTRDPGGGYADSRAGAAGACA